MSGAANRSGRPSLWILLVGVVVGVVTAKVMDRWPMASAGGEQDRKAALGMHSESFRSAAKNIAPSVVNIKQYRKVLVAERTRDMGMFGPFYRRTWKEDWKLSGIGSGFVIDAKQGYILTNNHVIEGAEELLVRLSDKREMKAELVGADKQTDLAVLKVTAEGLTEAELGDSDGIQVGDWVIASGNPFDLEQTVTAGIISAKGRKGLGLTRYEDFLQTDAAINPGNSGGPLVDLDGKVIGVNSAIFSKTEGYQGIGFAIPVNQAKKIAQTLIKDKRVIRGWMGVTMRGIPAKLGQELGLDDGEGLYVEEVAYRGPAHLGGMLPGDIVTEVNAKKVVANDEIANEIAEMKPGSKLHVKLIRNKKPMEVDVVLIEQPGSLRVDNE